MRTLLCLLFVAAAAPAATFTPIQTIPSEPSLVSILDAVYGPGNYFRIDDDSDRTWQPGQIGVRALATYAGAWETLGLCTLCDGSDDVFFDQTFSADGVFSAPLTVNGAASLFVASQFTWFDYAQFLPFVGKVYSDPAMNPAGADHMVTFGLFGQPGAFVLAFEDWLFTANPRSDRDYQDFVLEVTYLSTPPSEVPEPAAALTLLGGLAVLFLARRKWITA